MTPEVIGPWIAASMAPHWADRRKAYVSKRRRWQRKIGRPLAGDTPEPDPALLDQMDPEEG